MQLVRILPSASSLEPPHCRHPAYSCRSAALFHASALGPCSPEMASTDVRERDGKGGRARLTPRGPWVPIRSGRGRCASPASSTTSVLGRDVGTPKKVSELPLCWWDEDPLGARRDHRLARTPKITSQGPRDVFPPETNQSPRNCGRWVRGRAHEATAKRPDTLQPHPAMQPPAQLSILTGRALVISGDTKTKHWTS